MRPKTNSIITIVECIPINEPLSAHMQVVGVDRLTETRNAYKTIFENHYKIMREDNEVYYKKNLLIDNFINEQFTQIVSEEENWKYKISIAITNILMSALNVVGIIYPSIAANSKGANFVFNKDFADKKLQIVKAGTYEITDVNDSNISVRLIMNPERLCTDGFGEVTWKSPKADEMNDFTIQK